MLFTLNSWTENIFRRWCSLDAEILRTVSCRISIICYFYVDDVSSVGVRVFLEKIFKGLISSFKIGILSLLLIINHNDNLTHKRPMLLWHGK